MEPTPDNIGMAAERLMRNFGSRPGAPKTTGEWIIHARAYCSLVHNKQVSEIIGKPHSKIGDPNDADWIDQKMLGRSRYYPSPATMRNTYTAMLPAWDGIEGEEE